MFKLPTMQAIDRENWVKFLNIQDIPPNSFYHLRNNHYRNERLKRVLKRFKYDFKLHQDFHYILTDCNPYGSLGNQFFQHEQKEIPWKLSDLNNAQLSKNTTKY